MSHLTYHNFEGSATKRNTNTVKPANIGGWNPVTGEIHPDVITQIDQAFANVDMNLKHAGGKGWEQVFRVDSYHIPLDYEALEAMVRNLKEYMPNHEPIWTVLGVSRLAEDDMRVEIEVVAHDPK
ncbi:hypothetical protein AFCA_007316 [Aspergillus flavus]|nr:hypothetical protein AFCA_007316 [Aspergillus flavus]